MRLHRCLGCGVSELDAKFWAKANKIKERCNKCAGTYIPREELDYIRDYNKMQRRLQVSICFDAYFKRTNVEGTDYDKQVPSRHRHK